MLCLSGCPRGVIEERGERRLHLLGSSEPVSVVIDAWSCVRGELTLDKVVEVVLVNWSGKLLCQQPETAGSKARGYKDLQSETAVYSSRTALLVWLHIVVNLQVWRL